MAELEITIAPDGGATLHAASILNDLFEDYQFFQREAEKIDPVRDPLLYKRMTRASILAFFSYFDGVLNRWIAKIDQNFDLNVSVGAKVGRIRREVASTRGRPLEYLDIQQRKWVRNKIAHLKLGDDEIEIAEELLSGQFFHDAKFLLNWLGFTKRRLAFDLHPIPDRMMQPFIEVLGVPKRSSTPLLSEEDEELVRIAEMTFLELDAREAADGHS